MRTSQSTAQIDAVMALVQAELEPVRKNKTVEVEGRSSKWESRYATLDVLHAASRAALRKHGIAIYQGGAYIQGAGERLITRLAFNGEWIESDFPIKVSRDGAQGFGGGISFAKRWGLMGMVGLVAEGDPEEKQGYQDERAKPKRAASPAGLPQLLEAIRSAESHAEFAQRAASARAANPTGDGAAAVEGAIVDWLCAELGRLRSPGDLDALTVLRDLCNRVRPRGAQVRGAIVEAERRIGLPQ